MHESLEQLPRVLIVEEDQEVAHFIGECLSKFTQVPQCTTVVDSLSQLHAVAASTLAENMPDILIFGDMYQPGQSGIDVLITKVNGVPLYEFTKSALFSLSSADVATQRIYVPYNVELFIPKPIGKDGFQNLVATLFEREEKQDGT